MKHNEGTTLNIKTVSDTHSACMGGDLGELGGRSPKKYEMGDCPYIRPSNILRSSVVGCVRKYELSKRGVFYEIEVFVVNKGPY